MFRVGSGCSGWVPGVPGGFRVGFRLLQTPDFMLTDENDGKQ